MVIRILQTNHAITLKDQFNQAGGVERITFADGTVLGGSDWSLDAHLKVNAFIYGTAGNDTLTGTSGNGTFIGGLGDDRFNSGAGVTPISMPQATGTTTSMSSPARPPRSTSSGSLTSTLAT
ncbi:hypothetical protein NN6n1_01430 [Shinella zoogloeoides]